MAELPVRPAAEYVPTEQPRFTQPTEVAKFSRSADRKVHFDRRALRTYAKPALPASLDVGFERYVGKNADADEPAPLADVIAALKHHGQPMARQELLTFRNNLNKLLLTPYARSEDWEIGVERRADGGLSLHVRDCLLYTSPSPRDRTRSRMPSSA